MTIIDGLQTYFIGYVAVAAVLASIILPIWLALKIFDHPDAD